MSSPETLAGDYRPGGRPLTGRTVLFAMVAFFGVIFAMNVFLLKVASSTFRGLEVESAYRAGQEFNGTLAAAAVQRERGWAVDVHVGRRADGRVAAAFTVADRDGTPLAGLAGTARLAAPADTGLDVAGAIVETAPGRYEAVFSGAPEPGRWTLVTELEEGGAVVFRSRNRMLVD